MLPFPFLSVCVFSILSLTLHIYFLSIIKLTLFLLFSVTNGCICFESPRIFFPFNKLSCLCASSLSHILTLYDTMDYNPPLSMGFSRQENWSGLLFFAPGDLPNPGIKPVSPALAG